MEALWIFLALIYKISLENVQEFAKIAINAMKILNPYQTHFYMGSVNKNKE
ncbi:hypothetical protein JP0070_09820 [Helicobacter pylori]|nr:hypothetical protein JP0070_09820 [Helicobacter pylori]